MLRHFIFGLILIHYTVWHYSRTLFNSSSVSLIRMSNACNSKEEIQSTKALSIINQVLWITQILANNVLSFNIKGSFNEWIIQ